LSCGDFLRFAKVSNLSNYGEDEINNIENHHYEKYAEIEAKEN